MTEVIRILALWRELDEAGADYVVATVIAVEGPSYRKPGALLLLAGDGRRGGTISGGCLEAQVASRAWWLTANGPTVQRYSTAEDDGDRPFGSGCGGIVTLLLERAATARAMLAALAYAFDRRIVVSVVTVVEGAELGRRAFAWPGSDAPESAGAETAEQSSDQLQALAQRALVAGGSMEVMVDLSSGPARAWAHFRLARPGLWIFGAGDDAQPLLRLAKELGWFVCVSDGRSNLATRERFFVADAINVLPVSALLAVGVALPAPFADVQLQDAVVVMTHSFEQDARILATLLARDVRPAYIGMLGPQLRTRELLGEAALLLGLAASSVAPAIEGWLAELHAPTGLDLGADSPETIALSVLAEIQKVRTAASGLPLRLVRSSCITAGA